LTWPRRGKERAVQERAPGRLSVVVATRDRREELLEALERLTSLNPGTPIVVVDNGSVDGTLDAVALNYPAVRTIALGENRGAVARTVGVERCSTPYVAFSDDDSWWAPGALRRAADVLDANPTLGVVAARIVVGPEEDGDPTSMAMAASPLSGDDLPGPGVLGFIACGSVVRREAFLAAGGFSDVIFFGGEEEVLALDLASSGWRLAYVDDVVAHHHPSPVRDRRARRRLLARNWMLSAWMRRPVGVALRRTLAAGLGAGDGAAGPGAVLDVLPRLPAALRARDPVGAEVERQLQLIESGGK
jgi:GT2 family glycosyltransferase